MSVQAGIWNFDGRPVDRKLLTDFSESLKQQGPDGESCYMDGPIALLYRPFHTTAESRREHQPHRSGRGFVLTWDGRLDNRDDLIAELRGELETASSDVAILAAAFDRWETDCFRRLVGDWAVSIWKPEQRELIFAIDYMAVRHIFYYLKNYQVRWSTDLAPLVLLSGHKFHIDDDYIAGYFAHDPDCHLTPYREIREVPSGQFVRIRNGGVSVERFWRFRPKSRIRYKADAEYEEHFRHLFRQSVRRRLRSDSPVLAELNHVRSRKRKPIAISTLEVWEACLNNWLNPNIGDLPLSEINNAVLKSVVAKMSEQGLSPKTIDNYVPVVKMVVASAVDEQGEEIYPRKWNHEFIDLPVVEKDKQNTPSFSSEVMTGLARWKKERERMIFVLCGAGGLRVGEALGIEIDKHISPDFLTIFIQQKIHHGRVEQRLKTANGCRQVDLHPMIATFLKEFVGKRASGFLFCTRQGKPVSPSNIIRRHLHKALKELGYVNPFTGTHKAGNHAFRRFRNTYLRNYAECPEGLYKYWMGHAGKDMSDLYDKIKEDVAFRRRWAERCGFGFQLPSVVPNVPKCTENAEVAVAA